MLPQYNNRLEEDVHGEGPNGLSHSIEPVRVLVWPIQETLPPYWLGTGKRLNILAP